jgi:A/G-specific adenine glycosylase
MLQKEGGCRFGLEGEHAAGRSLCEFDRPGDARGVGTCDFDPTQNQGRVVESRARKSGSRGQGDVAAHRRGAGPALRRLAGLFVFDGLRHALSMPPARHSKQKGKSDRAAVLLGWYDVHHRELPWRARKGRRADPYHVWLSEIMLQQTTVQAVAAYYAKFLKAWPTLKSLADAPLDDVLTAWAGLGYYARARNLHAAARIVAYEMGGRFPDTAEGLRKLPGVGGYTAGAIAAIAYDRREAAVDANAERVLARLFAVDEPMPKAKARLGVLAQSLVPKKRAGDFAQALMDLGSLVCTSNRPSCVNCPWSDGCEARERGIQETLPVKAAKMVRPLKRGAAFVARDRSGAVLLLKRPEKGLLGGMMQPPLGPWSESFPSQSEALLQAPFRSRWMKRAGVVRHGFTHFELEIEVYVTEVDALSAPVRGGGKWVHDLSTAALPTVMKKIMHHANADAGPLFRQARSARKR